jgi:phage gpG-like protein
MIQITIDKKQIDSMRDKLKKLSPLDRESVTFKWLKSFGIEGERIVRKEILAGQVLHKRTAMLANSFGSRVGVENGTLALRIGSGVRTGGWAKFDKASGRYRGDGRLPYANIHETGGVIKPKKGKFLWIPIRKGSREALWYVRDRKKTLSQSGLSVSKKTGRLTGKSFSTQILGFVPVRSVTIPARHYMTIGAERLAPLVAPSLTKTIDKFFGSKN